MSKQVIDEKVVEMQFDNRQFEKNVQTTIESVGRLKSSLDLTGASKGLEDISAAASKCDMSPLHDALENVKVKFSALEIMGVTALQNITDSAIDTGKKIVSAFTIDPVKSGFQEYETQINAVQTILANTSSKGTTLDQVNNALDELNHYADMTIYNFTEMTRNIGTFTAAGVDLDTSVAAIKGIANLAAVSGSTSQQASTAMYQLSQALAAGTVKLQDWNSVVNAGMGGQVFQDALKETARVHGIAIDEMIQDEGSFRETLSKGWLTSDILTETLSKFTGDLNEEQLRTMGYTDEQIQSIIKMGKTANDAATKVKTFTQLFDTLKEAAQSGWTQSWETIVGDFEEAKELLTEISDIFSGLINASSDSRNKVLQDWKDLGGRTDLIDAARNAFEGILNIVKAVKNAFSDIFPPVTGKQLADITASIKNATLHFKNFWKVEEKGVDKIIPVLDKTSAKFKQIYVVGEDGVKKVVSNADKLKNTFKGAFAILDIGVQIIKAVSKGVGELLGEILPMGSGLLDVTSNMGEFLVSVDETIKRTDILGETVERVVDVVKLLINYFKDFTGNAFVSYIEGGEGLAGVLEVIFDKISDIVRLIFDIASVVTGKDLTGIGEKIVNAIQEVRNKVVDFAYDIQQKFDFHPLEMLHSLLERIQLRLSQLGEGATKTKSIVVLAFEAIGDALSKCQFLKILEGIWTITSKIVSGVAGLLGGAIESFTEALQNAEFDNIFDLLNSIAFGGMAAGITKFMNGLTDATGNVSGILESVTGILDGVRGCIEAYQTNIKAGTLMKIASAIAILATSIVVISLIDSEKLSQSLGAISVLFANLMASMAIFNKISGSMSNTTKACAGMITMSVAVLVLASALKKISSLNWDELLRGLAGVAGLSAVVVAVAKLVSDNNGRIIKGSTGLVIFAAAIKVLASACRDMATMSWSEVAKGLTGVGVLFAEIALFLQTAKFSGKAVTTATGIVILVAAMKILTSVCRDFGGMQWGEIGKGLAGIGALLAEIAVFTNVAGNAKHVVSSGIALTAIAGAMKIFASAMEDFGGMQWDEIAKGITAMGIALAEVALAMNLMPKNMVSTGTGLVIVGAALEMLANVLSKLGQMQWDEICRGLTTIGVALVELSIGLNLMTGTLSGSAALFIAATALAVLTPVLSILGAMSWTSIVKGLSSLAGIFVILGVSGAVLSSLVPAILGLAGALALVGVSALGIGTGLVLAGAGLSAIAVGVTALAVALAGGTTAIMASLAVIVSGIAGLIPAIMVQVGNGIIALCQVIADGAPAIGRAIISVLLSVIDVAVECIPQLASGILQVLVGVLEALVVYTPQIISNIMQFLIGLLGAVAENLPSLIKVAVEVLMSFFAGIVEAIRGIDVGVLLEGIAGIGILSAIMVALSAVASLIPGAMVGILGIGAVMAELALVIGAIGILAQLPGLSWLIGEGGKLLEGIGTAIGGFIGGIIGGFMGGISSQFPQIGEDLSAFMTNVTPFINGASAIKPEMLTGVNALADIIITLTKADILQGLTSWITGGSSLSSFGEDLVPFGNSMKRFAEAIEDIDMADVETAALTGKILTEMADTIPKTGGLVSFFTGENDMEDFGEKLIPFGNAMKEFSDAVDGLNADDVTAAAMAGKAMAEMASTLPNSGGVVSFFTGENDMNDFADQLIPFGKAMKEYSDAVEGINADAVTNSAIAGKAIVELANTLPNSGGVVGWFLGENDIGDFATQLSPFGKAMKEYSEAVEGINADAVTNSAIAGKAIVELADTLPNSGGVVGWFTGNNDIGEFGEQLIIFGSNFKSYSDYMVDVKSEVVTATANAAASIVELQKNLPKEGGWFSDEKTLSSFGSDIASFGSYFKNFYEYISGVNAEQLSQVIAQIGELVNIAKGVSTLDTKGMNGFSSALTTLGQSGINDFIKEFTDSDTRVISAVDTFVVTFTNEINNQSSNVSSTFVTMVDQSLEAVSNKQSDFNVSGSNLMSKMISGIKSKEINIAVTVSNIVTSCLNSINEKQTLFYNGGSTLMSKMSSGIASRLREAIDNTEKVLNGCKEKIEVYYTIFYNIGSYLVDGFASGIDKNTYKASATAKAMAEAAATAAKKALDEHSPSKVGYQIGDYFGVAFVNAIGDYVEKAKDIGKELGNSAKGGLQNSILQLKDIATGDLQLQPTIRPVFDLSEIQNGIDETDSLLNGLNGNRISTSFELANQAQNHMEYAGTQADNNQMKVAVEQLNKAVDNLGKNSGNTIENTFNIRGSNPEEIAEEVSNILQRQIERRDATWA